MRDLVIGVDASTTAVKAIAFDRDGGILGEAQRGYPLSSPHPGWFEQDPRDWQAALDDALSEIAAGIAPDRVAALCIGHQRETFALVDAGGAPLGPAILWLDERARPQVTELSRRIGRDRIRDISGKPPDPTPALYALAWLKEHRPGMLAEAACVLDVQGYLARHLTGRFATAIPSADPLGLLDLAAGAWDADLVAAAGLREDQLPDLVAPGAVIGELTREAAKATGLPSGALVIAGGGDGQMGGLGVGAIDGRAAYLSLGSGIVCGVHCADYRVSDAFRTLASPTGQGVMLESVLRSGMQLAEWMARLTAGSSGPNDIARLDAAAAAIAPGCDGVTVLPYFAGVMNPYWDESARGAVIGLSLSHGPAHLYRAALEALALEQGVAVAALEQARGRPIESFIVSGGGIRSRVLPPVLAAALNRPLALSPVREAVAVGAGLLAAAGAGLHADLPRALAAMLRPPRDIVSPDPALVEIYAERLAAYRRLFPALRPLFG